MEDLAHEPLAGVASRCATGGVGGRSDERATANCGNGERSSLPFLPGYAAAARGVCGGVGGTDLFGVDFAGARRCGRRHADDSRFEGYYGPARGGEEVP